MNPFKNTPSSVKKNSTPKNTVCTVFFILLLFCNTIFAQRDDSLSSLNKLKKLSLEELMDIEVTSISMRPEKLTEVASAIQLIPGEDIRRSSAVRLPEALRLASNLQIAKANSHDWSITARGFSGLPTSNGLLSNKLLAMIDGRSIYSPLFGGIYWDVQNVMLEDVDNIEVVSGPGGTLWGANAVNGVINVKMKSADQTQGLYVSQIAGTSNFLQDHTEMRYGSKIGEKIFYRIYGQHFEMKRTNTTTDTINRQLMKQGGFRMDYYPSDKSIFTLQGEFYSGDENNLSIRALVKGQNSTARFIHNFSDSSSLSIKFFVDHTSRENPASRNKFKYKVTTYDIDIQYRVPLGKIQSILVGGSYRYMYDDANILSLSPPGKFMPLPGGFIQDEITCVPDMLKLTIGSKISNNVFTGTEIQPSARIAFTPNKNNTIWTSVSRAVRTPARFDADLTTSTGEKISPYGFNSENVIAYELGYRIRATANLFLSFATFYNQYTDLRSFNSFTNTATPTIITNDQKADSWGGEFYSNIQATSWWRLRVGYNYFEKRISRTSTDVLSISSTIEGVDPKHQISFQSIMDLPKDISLDVIGRYIDALNSMPPIPVTPAYFTFDVHIAKQFNHLEVSIVGQNLLEKEHMEIGLFSIPRSVYAKVICRF